MTKIGRDASQSLINLAGNAINKAFMWQTKFAQSIGTAVVLGDVAGGTIAQFHSATGVGLQFDSSSAADKTGSTGMLTCRLWGCDIYDIIMYEDITCNGTDAVLTTNTDWKAVWYLEPLTYGSGKAAAGNCFIQAIGGAANYLGIVATGFQSSILNLYVPTKMVGFYVFDGWFTKVTTATDGANIYINTANGATQEVVKTVRTVAIGGEGAAALSTVGVHLEGILQSGLHNIFYGVDIGTTAQTLNWSITWGMRYV